MKNKIINMLMILTCLICFTNVKAENIDLNYNNNIIFLTEENANNDSTDESNTETNTETNTGTSNTDCSVLGEFGQDLQSIFNVFKIVAPILTLALSSYDFVVSITSKQAEGLQKSAKKFATRLVLVVILYLLPTVLNFFLKLTLASGSTCVE